MVNVSLLIFTANEFLQFWHFIITSALLSLLLDNLASFNALFESQARLLQIGHGYCVIDSPLVLFNIFNNFQCNSLNCQCFRIYIRGFVFLIFCM